MFTCYFYIRGVLTNFASYNSILSHNNYRQNVLNVTLVVPVWSHELIGLPRQWSQQWFKHVEVFVKKTNKPSFFLFQITTTNPPVSSCDVHGGLATARKTSDSCPCTVEHGSRLGRTSVEAYSRICTIVLESQPSSCIAQSLTKIVTQCWLLTFFHSIMTHGNSDVPG